ncbi:PREDICTED: 1-deoxy-D-xylulose-5-phosphate synthase, chloroplastic isoform X2 [Tarenaya hassleriana]|uniref:1-deoxy-D-xylulose-5-phosphate synthase, chloroplastic isoform X2 n=1 Tax=Tarenaya hassleriana TaxID=28532 RepID=UPI00053C4D31|nr:PREDICTED: 1-deoxy-D-xylulose-5-phosphate synthase, chloroplastic isoform X2 [Tarenaya hassleriana]
MGAASASYPFGFSARFDGNFNLKSDIAVSKFPCTIEVSRNSLFQAPNSTSKGLVNRVRACSFPKTDDYCEEKVQTPLLDSIENPSHLKNLSVQELKQLADEIRKELLSVLSKTQKSFKPGLAAVELTIALHYVFHAPFDKILWDSAEQTYAHKILTGRRSLMPMLRRKDGISGVTSRSESEYDSFGTGHGCNSISAGLGLAVARDVKGKKEHVVAVIDSVTITAGQAFEAMSNAGYLDSNMIVILNDSRRSFNPNMEEGSKASINALSSAMSKIQSSKLFRKLREVAKAMTKRIGKGMHEWAAKVDEYARGMMGPPGSTLFEELGLYYIGPVDGHNIEDLVCLLREVASLDSMGPVLVHVITEENRALETENNVEAEDNDEMPYIYKRTYGDCFVEALVMEAEKDKDVVVVHAGMEMDPSLRMFRERFPERYFNVGMAEQHAVTFSAGLSCGGLKPFCIIPSAFLQRAYDQVVHDVDRQSIPVRFIITSAGLVGSDGPVQCGAFDIAFMSCLPNMIAMAPADEDELVNMVATAASINDRPVCFRYPRGSIVKKNYLIPTGIPIEVGRGRVLVEGEEVALVGYGAMVQNCLNAQSLLSKLGIEVTVADARFCKPLDIKLLRQLCQNHSFLITVEEGCVGGFGSHVAQFIALDGQLDRKIKVRRVFFS